MVTRRHEPESLLRHLPAIYRESDALRELLSAFEAALLHADHKDHVRPALGDKIASIHCLFRPMPVDPASDATESECITPSDFLPWLATWVALDPSLVDILASNGASGEMDDESRAKSENSFRKVLSKIVPLHGCRGTRAFLENVLPLFVPEISKIDIDDRDLPGFEVGKSELGKNSWLVTYRPFHFRVAIHFAAPRADKRIDKKLERTLRHKVQAIIELSKPAHTTYEVHWEFV